jgi:hypothetical protein
MPVPGRRQSGFLAEFRAYSDNAPDREVQGHRKVVRDIVGVLHHADPQVVGLLRCRGFYWNSLENRFEIHLSYPQGHFNPQTLLDLLADPETRKGPKHPLNHRVDLAEKYCVGTVRVSFCGHDT